MAESGDSANQDWVGRASWWWLGSQLSQTQHQFCSPLLGSCSYLLQKRKEDKRQMTPLKQKTNKQAWVLIRNLEGFLRPRLKEYHVYLQCFKVQNTSTSGRGAPTLNAAVLWHGATTLNIHKMLENYKLSAKFRGSRVCHTGRTYYHST